MDDSAEKLETGEEAKEPVVSTEKKMKEGAETPPPAEKSDYRLWGGGIGAVLGLVGAAALSLSGAWMVALPILGLLFGGATGHFANEGGVSFKSAFNIGEGGNNAPEPTPDTPTPNALEEFGNDLTQSNPKPKTIIVKGVHDIGNTKLTYDSAIVGGAGALAGAGVLGTVTKKVTLGYVQPNKFLFGRVIGNSAKHVGMAVVDTVTAATFHVPGKLFNNPGATVVQRTGQALLQLTRPVGRIAAAVFSPFAPNNVNEVFDSIYKGKKVPDKTAKAPNAPPPELRIETWTGSAQGENIYGLDGKGGQTPRTAAEHQHIRSGVESEGMTEERLARESAARRRASRLRSTGSPTVEKTIPAGEPVAAEGAGAGKSGKAGTVLRVGSKVVNSTMILGGLVETGHGASGIADVLQHGGADAEALLTANSYYLGKGVTYSLAGAEGLALARTAGSFVGRKAVLGPLAVPFLVVDGVVLANRGAEYVGGKGALAGVGRFANAIDMDRAMTEYYDAQAAHARNYIAGPSNTYPGLTSDALPPDGTDYNALNTTLDIAREVLGDTENSTKEVHHFPAEHMKQYLERAIAKRAEELGVTSKEAYNFDDYDADHTLKLFGKAIRAIVRDPYKSTAESRVVTTRASTSRIPGGSVSSKVTTITDPLNHAGNAQLTDNNGNEIPWEGLALREKKYHALVTKAEAIDTELTESLEKIGFPTENRISFDKKMHTIKALLQAAHTHTHAVDITVTQKDSEGNVISTSTLDAGQQLGMHMHRWKAQQLAELETITQAYREGRSPISPQHYLDKNEALAALAGGELGQSLYVTRDNINDTIYRANEVLAAQTPEKLRDFYIQQGVSQAQATALVASVTTNGRLQGIVPEQFGLSEDHIRTHREHVLNNEVLSDTRDVVTHEGKTHVVIHLDNREKAIVLPELAHMNIGWVDTGKQDDMGHQVILVPVDALREHGQTYGLKLHFPEKVSAFDEDTTPLSYETEQRMVTFTHRRNSSDPRKYGFRGLEKSQPDTTEDRMGYTYEATKAGIYTYNAHRKDAPDSIFSENALYMDVNWESKHDGSMHTSRIFLKAPDKLSSSNRYKLLAHQTDDGELNHSFSLGAKKEVLLEKVVHKLDEEYTQGHRQKRKHQEKGTSPESTSCLQAALPTGSIDTHENSEAAANQLVVKVGSVLKDFGCTSFEEQDQNKSTFEFESGLALQAKHSDEHDKCSKQTDASAKL